MPLNDEQRAAIDHDGSTVVLAGPGSGKTHTLVKKVAHLLYEVLPGPFGVACLTFNNDAVNEFTGRLRREGLRPGRRLFLGTVHGFCLNRVIKPYGHLAGTPDLRDRKVLTAAQRLEFRQRSLDMQGVNENARWFEPTLMKIRNDLACGDALSSSYDQRLVDVAIQYEALLDENDRLDFGAMTFEALRIIEQNPAIADLVVCRYPWIAIDEYQDLGGVLHRVVIALQESGARIFAVGDPDQCIYEFSGAKPSTVLDLVESGEFHSIRLRYNYRSGSKLIETSQVALAEVREYKPDPDRIDPGEVILQTCEPGLEAHAAMIVTRTIPDLVSNGVDLHEIAILYPGKGPMLDAIRAELEDSGIPHRLERDGTFPSVPIVRWLRRCARFALSRLGTGAESLADLAGGLLYLIEEAGGIDDLNELRVKTRLFSVLDEVIDSGDPLGPWLGRLADELDLEPLLDRAGRPDEAEALGEMLSQADNNLATAMPTVGDFAHGAIADGRVVVTTYHSSKGRQFDAVLLPGLQHTLVPRARWNPRIRRMETTNIREERRLFYVAFTRSRHLVVLYYSDRFINKNGYPVSGRSMFVDEIAARLDVVP